MSSLAESSLQDKRDGRNNEEGPEDRSKNRTENQGKDKDTDSKCGKQDPTENDLDAADWTWAGEETQGWCEPEVRERTIWNRWVECRVLL